MTLADLRTLVREAVLEKTTDKGLIESDTVLDRWINVANKSLWTLGLQRNPAKWAERSTNKTMTTTGAFALGGLIAPATADTLIHRVHLVERLYGTDWLPVFPMEGLNEHVEWDGPGSIEYASPDARFYVEGGNLRFSPAPTASVTFRAKFTRIPTDMTTGTDVALGGQYLEHHALVAFRTAQLFYKRDEVKKTPWDDEVDKLQRDFIDSLRRSQGGITRRVNRRRAY